MRRPSLPLIFDYKLNLVFSPEINLVWQCRDNYHLEKMKKVIMAADFENYYTIN